MAGAKELISRTLTTARVGAPSATSVCNAIASTSLCLHGKEVEGENFSQVREDKMEERKDTMAEREEKEREREVGWWERCRD